MFSKRHYEAIAAVLRANEPEKPVPYQSFDRQEARGDHHRYIVHQLGVFFAQDNPRFDGGKFLTAATRPE